MFRQYKEELRFWLERILDGSPWWDGHSIIRLA